jgi:hypothetical protein
VTITGSTAIADVIRYAWSGVIVSDGADDPWSIGQHGKSFSLSATVSSDAADVLSDSVQFSAFNLNDADLVIEGQQVSYVGNGTIDFTDNSGGILDVVLVAGEFQSHGTKVEIESAVALDPATFMFTHENELLPVLTSTTNMDRISCCRPPYVLVVQAGSAVIVVPEPTNGLMCFLGWILIGSTRRTR